MTAVTTPEPRYEALRRGSRRSLPSWKTFRPCSGAFPELAPGIFLGTLVGVGYGVYEDGKENELPVSWRQPGGAGAVLGARPRMESAAHPFLTERQGSGRPACGLPRGCPDAGPVLVPAPVLQTAAGALPATSPLTPTRARTHALPPAHPAPRT